MIVWPTLACTTFGSNARFFIVTWIAPPELEPEAEPLVELEAAGAELEEPDELEELEPHAARAREAITRGRRTSGRLMSGSVPAS
jgi:hypothetical protein